MLAKLTFFSKIDKKKEKNHGVKFGSIGKYAYLCNVKSGRRHITWMIVALLTMAAGLMACGDDEEEDLSGERNAMTLDGQLKVMNTGKAEIQDAFGNMWFMLYTSDGDILNIMVAKDYDGKTIDLSRQDNSNYPWQIYYTLAQPSATSRPQQLFMGAGNVNLFGNNLFEQGSTFYYKTVDSGSRRYELSFDIKAKDFSNDSVMHSLKGSYNGKMSSIEDFLNSRRYVAGRKKI